MSYVVRLGHPESVALLRKFESRESDLFIKLSMQYSLIRMCQFDAEEQLVERIRENDEWDRLNRGYHLVYYGDWRPQDSPPYRDPGRIPWDKTMKALLRNIESPEPGYVAMRRVNLLTAKRFMETRGCCGPLCSDVLMCIEKAIGKFKPSGPDMIPEEFLRKVEAVYRDLEKCWEMMMRMPDGPVS